MDRATELADAFVEVKFADYEVYRTAIARRTLNPIWNEDFRFEVSDDADLQNEPLEIKILDYDQITYNDSIGTVFIDLNALLSWDSGSHITGWFPIFDTLRGIRGELNCQVRLQFFGDINPFKDSSAGVQFFTIKNVPPTYEVASILGFVGALDIEDDPEYHWSDNFRTPRTSNEARTRIMFRLSGQLRRRLGKKVLELGGNAVVGYKQYFDLEAESRNIIARAIGTAVRLGYSLEHSLGQDASTPAWIPYNLQTPGSISDMSPNLMASSPAMLGKLASVSDELVPSPTTSISLGLSAMPMNATSGNPTTTVGAMTTPFKTMEHILTIDSFPAKSILGMGGFISAVSVKMLDDDSKEVREAWWTELRDELKSHARSLGCSFVIGYSEHVTIEEDLVVLQVTGTAANMDLSVFHQGPDVRDQVASPSSSPKRSDVMKSPSGTMEEEEQAEGGSFSLARLNEKKDLNQRHRAFSLKRQTTLASYEEGVGGSFTDAKSFEKEDSESRKPTSRKRKKRIALACQSCHITYRRQESPFPMAFARCSGCKKRYVPEMVLSTIEPPPELQTLGKGVLIEAHVCRQKKAKMGESAIGETLMTAVATGTAVYVKSLPAPPSLKVFRNLDIVDEEDKKLVEIQKTITHLSEQNRKQLEWALIKSESAENELSPPVVLEQGPFTADPPTESMAIRTRSLAEDTDSSDDSSSSSLSEDELNKSMGHMHTRRQTTVVQIDDEQDEDLVLLLDPTFPDGFHLCNTEFIPKSSFHPGPSGMHVQMMTLVKQGLIHSVSHHPNRQLSAIFKSLYQEMQFQLSYLTPCLVAGIDYTIQLPKDNEVQIQMTAVALGNLVPSNQDQMDELNIFSEQVTNTPLPSWNGLMSGFRLGSRSMFNPPKQTTKSSFTPPVSADSDEEDPDPIVFAMEEEEEDKKKDVLVPNPPSDPLDESIESTAEPVLMTPLSYVPQAKMERFMGHLSLHFVKESNIVYEAGLGQYGMGGFSHTFLAEMYAVLRAHTAALGGNALVGMTMEQAVFSESIKNQGYAFMSVSGDVVKTSPLSGSVRVEQDDEEDEEEEALSPTQRASLSQVNAR